MKPRRLQLSLRRRAFAQARAVRAPHAAWRPLALCWQRPAPRAPVTRVSPRVQHLRQNFQTQVHWHLGVIAASAPGAVNTSSPSITPALMRAAGHTLVELRRISQRREHSLQMTERVRRERLTIIEPMPAHGRQRVADAVPHARSRVSAAEPRFITPRLAAATRATRAPANSGPRIISSTHRTFCPTTMVEMPSPARVATTCVQHGRPSSVARWNPNERTTAAAGR